MPEPVRYSPAGVFTAGEAVGDRYRVTATRETAGRPGVRLVAPAVPGRALVLTLAATYGPGARGRKRLRAWWMVGQFGDLPYGDGPYGAMLSAVDELLPAGSSVRRELTLRAPAGATGLAVEVADASDGTPWPAGAWIEAGPATITDTYRPEAQLLVAGVVLDDLDLVPGFRESAEAASLVQYPLGDPTLEPAVTIRPTRRLTGRLTAHLIRTTERGGPGARADRLLASIRSGVPHTLRFLGEEDGLTDDYLLIPTGPSDRAKEARSSVWSLDFGYERTAPL